MVKINLHLHSNYSDGFYSVKKILETARARGFEYIAITDHNEIRGSIEAVKLSKEFSVTVVPGIEIFFLCNWKITELLVYFKNVEDLKSFFGEFIGNRLLPIVKDEKQLANLINKYNGFTIQPHSLSAKGCLRNGFEIGGPLETKNPMSKDYVFPEGKHFGGADLHLWLDSLNCYTEVERASSIKEIFSKENSSNPINNSRINIAQKSLQAIVNLFFIIKYLSLQTFKRKLSIK